MMSISLIVMSGVVNDDPIACDDERPTTTFRLACTRWDAKTKSEVTDFYAVRATGAIADTVLRHAVKGTTVAVEGRPVLLNTVPHVEIVATRVSYFGGPRRTLEAK